MESLSNKTNAKERVSSLQTDLEALGHLNKEIYESIQEELKKAKGGWEKAREPLLKLEKKKIHSLRSIKSPPYEILGVLLACISLLGGDIPESYIKGDAKKESIDLSWKACRKMLENFDFFREQMLDIKRLIDEERMSFKKTERVRKYLDMPWFHVSSLKMKSMPVSLLGETVINIIRYFDTRREICLKIRIVVGNSGEKEGNNIYESQERED